MECFRIFVYVEDYDFGTGIAVTNDTALMDVYKKIFEKLKLPIPNDKEAVFSTKTKWAYALRRKVGDLGDISEDDILKLKLWDVE